MKFASVLVDTYNHERFIEKAIVSVLEQDFPAPDFEILVVDDGSTDRTAEIARKFAPRVRLLRKENGGQASAFNAGIPECKGEIVAFLDGDDWWAKNKLSAVAEAIESDAQIGLIGHGITTVYSDGRRHEELVKHRTRLDLNAADGARAFRLAKSFLGTSRMTYRKSLLHRIGNVPETLRIEADEYLFTLAGFLAPIEILQDSLTFYRLHSLNAFQLADGNEAALRRKLTVLMALEEALKLRLREMQAPPAPARIITDWVETEAQILRLGLENGYPWETVRFELRNYRIAQEHVSAFRLLLKCISLLPAIVMPSRSYYALIQRVSNNRAYQAIRKRWLPFAVPAHVDGYWTTGR